MKPFKARRRPQIAYAYCKWLKIHKHMAYADKTVSRRNFQNFPFAFIPRASVASKANHARLYTFIVFFYRKHTMSMLCTNSEYICQLILKKRIKFYKWLDFSAFCSPKNCLTHLLECTRCQNAFWFIPNGFRVLNRIALALLSHSDNMNSHINCNEPRMCALALVCTCIIFVRFCALIIDHVNVAKAFDFQFLGINTSLL